MTPSHHAPFQRAGFTLVESLCVILILSLILAFAAPSMLEVIRASRLTAAAETVTGKLVEAQGLALTFSSDVELRLYKSNSVSASDGSSGQALQLFQWVEGDPDAPEASDNASVQGVANLKKIGPREYLPPGVTISQHPDFSSV